MVNVKGRKLELPDIGTPTESGEPGLYLLVNPPEPATRWYGPTWAAPHTPVGLVNVISRHARGQCRGYWVVDGKLHICAPNYEGDWPELDAAVTAALGMPVAEEQTP